MLFAYVVVLLNKWVQTFSYYDQTKYYFNVALEWAINLLWGATLIATL